MLTFIAGQDITVDVLFVKGVDETVVPDIGSVKYDLFDNSGAPLDAAVAVTTDGTDTHIPIPILAAKNAKASGKDFEMRTLRVHWEDDGAPYITEIQYRIADFVPHSVSPLGVRSLLGLAKNELPDEDLDIYAAYVEVAEDIGSAALLTALTAGNSSTISANRAIAAKTLLNVLGSIEIRTMQEDKSNTAQLSRFSKIDFATVRAWLQKLYDDAVDVVVPPSTTGSDAVLITTMPTIDSITGVTPVIPGS